MKNKIMIIVCFGLLNFSAVSFADDKQVTPPVATVAERAKEKVIFNRDQVVYNDKTNKDFRAQKLVDKKIETKEQDKKKVQDEQEVKNGIDEKNVINAKETQDGKNEQYDKRLTVKF